MLIGIVIIIYITASVIALIHPRTALLCFWPLVLCYPAWLLWGIFPLNAGFDDLFLICLFVGSLVKGQGRVRVGWPVIAAILFCIFAVLGDLSSILTREDLMLSTVWKRGLKSAGLVFLTFSMCSVITTPRQIKKMIYFFLMGAGLGGIFVIFYSVNEYAYNPFQVPYWAQGLSFQLHEALGPFNTHDTAGGVLGFAVLTGYFLIRFTKGGLEKTAILMITGILFLGLILCNSRSGWIFAAVPLILSSLLSKRKALGIFLLVIIIIGVLISTVKFEVFERRLEKTAQQWRGQTLESRTAGRFIVWKDNLSHPSAKWLLFGEGFAVQIMHPHSNYISIFKNMGCIGILFWTAYYVKIFKKSSWLKKYDPVQDMSAIVAGVFWSYIGYLVFFVTATPVMWSSVRYIDFFLMTLVCLRYKQVETGAEYVYLDESYENEPSYYYQCC